MSAFLCSARTINALANFAMRHAIRIRLNAGDYIDATTQPQVMANLLLAANMASLRERYPEDWKAEREITYKPAAMADLAPVVIIKVAQCFNYQACETPDYYESDAARLVREILEHAIRALPGYSDAPWGLDGDEPGEVRTMKASAQRSILDMCFPTGAVDLEEKAMPPILVQLNQQMRDKPPAPKPAPAKQPAKKQPKPNDDQQPDGPF